MTDNRNTILAVILSGLVLIGWQGAMLGAINLAAYAWALGRYGAGAHARTIALLVLVSGQHYKVKQFHMFYGFVAIIAVK